VVEIGPCPARLPSAALAVFAYGGVLPRTHVCVVRDVAHFARLAGERDACEKLRSNNVPVEYAGQIWQLSYHQVGQDALIGRSRSRVATDFLKAKSESVLIMVDHDITWQGPGEGYEGDLAHIARLAAEHNAVVGAMISKKVKGEGIASMIDTGGMTLDIAVGSPGLVESPNVGSGMTAYPRSILQAIYDKLGGDVPPGFCPMFVEAVVDHPLDARQKLHVSEDWIVTDMARKLGFKTYLATRPITGHVGEHVYTVLEDAFPADMVTYDRQPEPEPVKAKPVISLLHATRWRPQAAQDAHDVWMARASGEYEIEYIYSIDSDDPESLAWGLRGNFVICGDSRGNVDAYNRAAYASRGDILVQVHDDVEPPPRWDAIVAERLDVTRPQVLHVDDGLSAEVNKNVSLIPVMICTRKWAKDMGGLFHPEYVSVFCDDDASEKARAREAVVAASDITFRHHWRGAHHDDTQSRSYAPANWEAGKELLEARRADGFADHPELWPS